MLIAFAIGARMGNADRSNQLRRKATRPGRVSTPARALTLLECLLAIMIVAMLIALAGPWFSAARNRSRDLVSLANLRSHAGTFGAYAADYREHFPYFTDPHATYSVVRVPSRGIAIRTPYFVAHAVWNIALAEQYYDGEYRHASFFYPGLAGGWPGDDKASTFTDYYYGCVFLAAAAYWNSTTRTGPEQWGPTAHPQVLYPGQKAVLIEVYPWLAGGAAGEGDGTGVGFVDGSARRLRKASFGPGYPRGDGPYRPASIHLGPWPQTLHTLDGVRGRDVR